ncbi:MAG: MGMT family protein [Actinomycetota bacterium]|nr:MGMT family protein [Actinomycetota bacterium]
MTTLSSSGPTATATAPQAALPALHTAVLATPAGPVALVVSPEDDVVRAAGFGPLDELLARLHPRLLARGAVDGARRSSGAQALAAYAAGDVHALGAVTIEQPGGPFFCAVWTAMRAISPGETLSYAALAAHVGSARAARAVGSACARNLVAPFVPCHRVVRSGGALGGYVYGLSTKEKLLAHELRNR